MRLAGAAHQRLQAIKPNGPRRAHWTPGKKFAVFRQRAGLMTIQTEKVVFDDHDANSILTALNWFRTYPLYHKKPVMPTHRYSKAQLILV
jgi:hypothetical protein